MHLPEVDPNFLNMSARSTEELKHKSATQPGLILNSRRDSIRGYIAEAKAAAEKGGSFEKKLVPFLEDKAQANEALWTVYNGQAGDDKEKAFFAASAKVWGEELPKAFEKLEGLITGPYVLGDQIVSVAFAAWDYPCIWRCEACMEEPRDCVIDDRLTRSLSPTCTSSLGSLGSSPSLAAQPRPMDLTSSRRRSGRRSLDPRSGHSGVCGSSGRASTKSSCHRALRSSRPPGTSE